MSEFSVVIDRKRPNPRSIGGEMSVNGTFLCYTLELPWRWNQRSVSCVPLGEYPGFIRYDKADGWRIQLTGVPGRSGIQIHVGNYPRHMKGCVLVGTSYASNAVLHSKKAYSLLKKTFYGSDFPKATPDHRIRVKFQGILATPWGDYPDPGERTV